MVSSPDSHAQAQAHSIGGGFDIPEMSPLKPWPKSTLPSMKDLPPLGRSLGICDLGGIGGMSGLLIGMNGVWRVCTTAH